LSKIRTAVIGTGAIAKGVHLPALMKHEDVDVVAVCDIVEEAAQEAVDKFGVPSMYLDYRELLKREDIDAVHVCTGNKMHSPISVDALKSGKHVMVEKPMARNAAEAGLMAEAARATGKKLMVAQCMRFSEEAQCIQSFIDAGELGDVYFGRVWALRRRGIPSWGVFIDKEEQGGGALIDIGVHALDMTLAFMGHPKPVTCSGQAFGKIGNSPGHVGQLGDWDWARCTVEDYAAAFVRFDNGASLIIESSFAANLGDERMNGMVLGTKGGAETNPFKIYSEGHGALLDITPVWLPEVQKYEAEIRAFYDSIHSDSEVPITPAQTLNVMKIIDAIYRSSEERREVAID